MEKEERLMQIYDDAIKAFHSLNEVLTFLKKDAKDLDPFILQGLYDSVIQRFEITYDTVWKYLKAFFLKKGIEVTFPREAFQQCGATRIVTREEANKLSDMVTDRNLTTHLYSQATADKIRERIILYAPLIKKLLSATQP